MEKYYRSFLLGIQNAMEYRANFLLTMVSAIFPIFIQFFLWTSIYSGNPDEVINGYTYAGIITYSVLAGIVSRLIRTGFEYEITDDIKNGGLNRFIIRPIDYRAYRLCVFVGQKLVHTVMISFLIVPALAFLGLRFDLAFTPPDAVFFCLSLVLAFLLNFMIFFSVGMWAFWLSEIGFLYEAVRIVIIMLSGGIFPLEVFGPGANAVLGLLPFRYTINFPIETLTGNLSTSEHLRGIVLQAVWILAFYAVSGLLWRAGNRRYVAVGG